MSKSLIFIGFVACLISGCRKDMAVPASLPTKNNSAAQADSLENYLGNYTGILQWAVAGGSSGTDTVSLHIVKSSDKSTLYVYDGAAPYPFDAVSIIRHQDANTSGPTYALKFSNDSLLMFVMQGPRFYHYYCRKQ